MATLTIPEKTTATEERELAESQVGLLTREEVSRVEKEVAAILAPAPAAAPAFPKMPGLLARMARLALGLWDQLSGPPMTGRERCARDLAETRFHNYTGFTGY